MSRVTSFIIISILIASLAASAQKQEAIKAISKHVKGNPMVAVKTSFGTIKIELFAGKAPISVKNFLSYVDEKYFDNTVFHRVIKGFMIQGGGFAATDPIRQKPTKAQIKNESDNGLKNERGTIAMARTPDPNSATSQFFINVVDNRSLDRSDGDAGYAVFGKVIEGMDIVDKIRVVETGSIPAIALNGGKEIPTTFTDVPRTKVVIETIRRLKAKK